MVAQNSVVVIGASGFGRESLDVLEAMKEAGHSLEIIGVVDDNPAAINLQRLAERKIEYLGTLKEWIEGSPKSCKYVLAIGNPTIRHKLSALLDKSGFDAFTAVHPSAVIGSQVVFGSGAVVCSGAVISTNVRLGVHVHINPNVTIGHDSILEDYVSINPAATISGEVLIMEETLIGAATTVLQGLTIGNRSLVGASSCVTKDISAGKVVKGIPAR